MDARCHRGRARKLERAPGSDEQHLVPIWRRKALPQIRCSGSIDEIMPLVFSLGLNLDTQLSSSLLDSNPNRGPLDMDEAPIVLIVVREVRRTFRHVLLEHVPQFTDGTSI